MIAPLGSGLTVSVHPGELVGGVVSSPALGALTLRNIQPGCLIQLYNPAQVPQFDTTQPIVGYDPPTGTPLPAPGRTIVITATDEAEIVRMIVSVELTEDPDTEQRLWEMVYNGDRFADKYLGSSIVSQTTTQIVMNVVRAGGFAVGDDPRFETIVFDKGGNIAVS